MIIYKNGNQIKFHKYLQDLKPLFKENSKTHKISYNMINTKQKKSKNHQ